MKDYYSKQKIKFRLNHLNDYEKQNIALRSHLSNLKGMIPNP